MTESSGIQLNPEKVQQLQFDQKYEDGPNNNYIVEIFPLEDDKILIVTQVSLYVIDQEMSIISSTEDPMNISSATMSNEKNLWVGSHNGDLLEVSIDGNSISFSSISVHPDYSVLSLEEDKSGNVWIGSENDGLSVYFPHTGDILKMKENIRNPNSISSNFNLVPAQGQEWSYVVGNI